MSTFSGADSMTSAVQRILVQTTPQDKKSIVPKAKKLDIPMSELMRRGAFAYQSGEADAALGALADAAKAAAERAGAAIDDALDVIQASNPRMGALTAMIKMEDKVNRQADAMKVQQAKIEDLTGRVIRLEAQLELLTGAALVKKIKGD